MSKYLSLQLKKYTRNNVYKIWGRPIITIEGMDFIREENQVSKRLQDGDLSSIRYSPVEHMTGLLYRAALNCRHQIDSDKAKIKYSEREEEKSIGKNKQEIIPHQVTIILEDNIIDDLVYSGEIIFISQREFKGYAPYPIDITYKREMPCSEKSVNITSNIKDISRQINKKELEIKMTLDNKLLINMNTQTSVVANNGNISKTNLYAVILEIEKTILKK